MAWALRALRLCQAPRRPLIHPERYIELNGEEKRKEGDRGDQEEKRGNQKGREQASQ